MHRYLGLVLLATTLALSGCSTVSDLVVSHIPERHSGRPRVEIDLGEQQAYLFRGQHQTASSRISSGREGHRTPLGRFSVIRKDEDHRSSLYGEYVDEGGRVVRRNVDVRRQARPRGSHLLVRPCPSSLSSRRAMDCTPAICPGNRRRTAVFACLIGRRGNSTARSGSARLS